MKHPKQTANYFSKVDDYIIDNEMCYTFKRKTTDRLTVHLNNQEYFAETPNGKVLALEKWTTVYIRYHFKGNKFYIYANGHKNYLQLVNGDKWELLESYLSSKPDKVVVDLQRMVKQLTNKCNKLDQECANLKNRLKNEKTVYGLRNL